MDAAIVGAAELERRTQDDGPNERTAELVMKTSEEDLIKYLEARVADRSGDPAQYLRAVWQGTSAQLSRLWLICQAPHSILSEAKRSAQTFWHVSWPY